MIHSSNSPFAAIAGPRPSVLLVVNQVEHAVSFVDPEARREISRLSVGVNGHEVAVSPDGELAYVPIYGSGGVGTPGTDGDAIDIISLPERRVVGRIAPGRPARPHLAEFGPDGLLYVTAEVAEAVDVIDPRSRRVVASIPTGRPQSHMLALSPDGRRAYTANVNTGTVSVLDLAARKHLTVIEVTRHLQRISISPDGRRIFTHDQDAPRIAVIDAAADSVTGWIALSDIPYASTPTPDGRWLLVAFLRTSQIAVVTLQSSKLARVLDITGRPMKIIVRPDGAVAYISCFDVGVIDVLDLAPRDMHSWRVDEPIRLSPGIDGMAWASANTSRTQEL